MGIVSTLASFGAGYVAGATTGPPAKERLAGTVAQPPQATKEKNIRRLDVVEHGKAIGIVSLGDISIQTEPGSVLSDISAATSDR